MTEQREEYTVVPMTPAAMMPAVDMETMLQRRNQMVEFFKAILVEGTDYGTIPGTQKPTLYKPGAEKLKMFYRLTHRFEILERIEDWDRPLFYYLIRCHLYHNGIEVGQGDGSCNSHESKYRYRQSERICPNCSKPSIIKGKAEFGGGWVCFTKKGGCGAKFKAGDPAIEEQPVGRVENTDVADQANTILKQAEKRAFVGAVIITTNASEFVTQDLEDILEGEYQEQPAQPTTKTESVKPTNSKPQADSKMMWKGKQPPVEPPEAPPEPTSPATKPQPTSSPVKIVVDGDMPNTAIKLLEYVNQRVLVSYDNIYHLRSAIRKEMNDSGWQWCSPTDIENWQVALDAAMKHAAAKVPADSAPETVNLSEEMEKALDAPGE